VKKRWGFNNAPHLYRWCGHLPDPTHNDSLPIIDWVGTCYREDGYRLLLEIGEEEPRIVWFLGVWPDIDIARAFSLPLEQVVRARRLIGAPAMTLERNAAVERKVGPLCELLVMDDCYEDAFNVRRWAAGLNDVGDRRRGHTCPGEAWWTWETIRVLDYYDSRDIGTRNCKTCRYWRGHQGHPNREQSHRLAPYCMAPKGALRTIGRHWLEKSGGGVGKLPFSSKTLCPAWAVPRESTSRQLIQRIIKGKETWQQAKPEAHHHGPKPFPPYKGHTITRLPSWQALMDQIRSNLDHLSTQ